MKVYAPNYYKKFKCIAGKCRHTCCQGWEIDVDEDSLDRYYGVEGDFGKRLRDSIANDGECAFFKLSDNERCPFLNKENLCDIIINLGEEWLCGICREHPRFRSFLSDREELGVGLCCEAAARLIVDFDEEVCLEVISDDGVTDELSSEDEEFLALREEIFKVLCDNSRGIDQRLLSLSAAFGCDKMLSSFKKPSDYAETLEALEYMESEWRESLFKMRQTVNIDTPLHLDNALGRLGLCFVARHLYNGDCPLSEIRERLALCLFSVNSVRLLYGCLASENLTDSERLSEAARLYSAEVEYSEENTECLLDLFRREGI